MNYGRFFRLNNDKSDLSRGIAFYDYIWLQDKDCVKNGTPEYPVYLTVSHDSIDFHVHYHDDYTDQEGKHIHKHLHNIILTLPLSANIEIKDGLTEALVKGWKTNFPKYDEEGSNYLWKLHWKTFWKNRKWEKSDVSYFELGAFVLKDKEKTWEELMQEANDFDNEKEYIAQREKNAKNEKINRFIRKLILDFLFDLEHTKVFQTSPHYEHISVKLKENYFFSALAAKANFYYQRGELLQKYEQINRKNKLSVYTEYYLKAEKEWTKCIRSPKANHNFNDFQDKWFVVPQEEMDKVYGKDLKKINKITKDNTAQAEEIKNCRNKSSKWFVWHYKWGWNWMWKKGFFDWHLLFPKMIAAILTAWVTIIIGSDLLPASKIEKIDVIYKVTDSFKNVGLIVAFGVVVAFILYLFILYSINKRCPGIFKKSDCCTKWKICFRPFRIMLLSFIFSVLLGVLATLTFGDVDFALPLFDKSCNYSEPNPFFWSCVFLAMFIGIVLQLATDEKYTEE